MDLRYIHRYKYSSESVIACILEQSGYFPGNISRCETVGALEERGKLGIYLIG